jgi:hypothetical protein
MPIGKAQKIKSKKSIQGNWKTTINKVSAEIHKAVLGHVHRGIERK